MKTGDLTIVYGAVAVLSVLLFAAYFLWEKKRERNFLLVLGCVSAANVGYFLLAAAGSLAFADKVGTLSSAERRILDYYIAGHDAADIPELAFISIHTVKKHNHSICQKLEVSSRDELMLYIELFRCCDRLDELTAIA